MGTTVMEKPTHRPRVYSVDDVFTPFTKKVIEGYAGKLLRSPHFQSYEKDDLVQELGIALWQSMETFDAGVAHFNCYATTVISRTAKSMLRQRRRLKRTSPRDARSSTSSEEVGSAEPMHLGPVTEHDASRRLQTEHRSLCESVDLREDVESVLQTLPSSLEETARALMQHPTSAAAKRLRISRATLHRRIDLLREHFAAAALNESQ